MVLQGPVRQVNNEWCNEHFVRRRFWCYHCFTNKGMGVKELRQCAQIHPMVSLVPSFAVLELVLLAIKLLVASPIKSFCNSIAHLLDENVITRLIQGVCMVTSDVLIKLSVLL